DGMVRRGGSATRPADTPVASDARAGLASDPDGYFCAVEDGQIRGMVSALVRGRVWYLSMFFVLPGDQGRGLGRALLERALAYGEARGAEVRCTWATLDPRAQARYVMAGMAPRWPIYRLEGDATAVARLRARVGPAAGRDETALLQAVAAAANAGGGGNVTVRVPGACASLLEALVGSGFRIGELAVFLASRPFGRHELYLPSGPILY